MMRADVRRSAGHSSSGIEHVREHRVFQTMDRHVGEYGREARLQALTMDVLTTTQMTTRTVVL